MTLERIYNSFLEFINKVGNPLQDLDFQLEQTSNLVEIVLKSKDSQILWTLDATPEVLEVNFSPDFKIDQFSEIGYETEFEFFYQVILAFLPVWSKYFTGTLESLLSLFLDSVTSWKTYLDQLAAVFGKSFTWVADKGFLDTYFINFDGVTASIDSPIQFTQKINNSIDLFTFVSVFFLQVIQESYTDYNYFLGEVPPDEVDLIQNDSVTSEGETTEPAPSFNFDMPDVGAEDFDTDSEGGEFTPSLPDELLPPETAGESAEAAI